MTETWFTKRVNGRTVHNWPSNFFIEPDGSHVEGEFQAAKHHGHPWRQASIMRSTPAGAKKLGRRWRLSDYQTMEWDNRKIGVMKDLLRQKVEDHAGIAVALLTTGDVKLVETNWWHDHFWGECTCHRCLGRGPGENHLGEIWMEIRASIAE